MSAKKTDQIRLALDRLEEATHALAIHGAGGYTTDTSALDVVFLRAFKEFAEALDTQDNADYYDPDYEIRSRFN